MKYIPNQNKICSVCGNPILYNEEYVGKDVLSAGGEVHTETRHYQFCGSGDLAGLSLALSGVCASAMAASGMLANPASAYRVTYGLSPKLAYLVPRSKSKSLKLLWVRILRILFGGNNGKTETT